MITELAFKAIRISNVYIELTSKSRISYVMLSLGVRAGNRGNVVIIQYLEGDSTIFVQNIML